MLAFQNLSGSSNHSSRAAISTVPEWASWVAADARLCTIVPIPYTSQLPNSPCPLVPLPPVMDFALPVCYYGAWAMGKSRKAPLPTYTRLESVDGASAPMSCPGRLMVPEPSTETARPDLLEPPLVDRSSGQFSNKDLNIWHIPLQHAACFASSPHPFCRTITRGLPWTSLASIIIPSNNLPFLQHLLEN